MPEVFKQTIQLSMQAVSFSLKMAKCGIAFLTPGAHASPFSSVMFSIYHGFSPVIDSEFVVSRYQAAITLVGSLPAFMALQIAANVSLIASDFMSFVPAL